MAGESGISKTKKVHHYYKCVNTKKKKLCDKKAVKKDWIENIVVEQIMKVIMDDNAVLYIADLVMDLQARENINLPMLKKQLSKTENAIKNMLDAIQQGVFTSSTKQRLEELEKCKSDLEVSIIQEEMQRPLLTKEQVTFWLCRFRKFDITKLEQRQRLIDSFVNSVYVYDDRLIITFNYKDGSKTLSLSDIEGSDLSRFGAPKPSRKRRFSHYHIKISKVHLFFFARAFVSMEPR